MRNPSRVPAGTGVRGGQYATQEHAETDITLSEDLFGGLSPTPDAGYRPISSVHDGEDFSHATMGGTDLRQARARRANFDSADLRGADLTGIDAGEADFSKADLTGADLTDGRFDGAVFHDAAVSGQFDGTVFDGADLSAAVVGSAERASFRGASLRGATLSGHFEGCDFRGADFSGAQMDHGYHKKANRNLSDVSFSDCRFDETPLEDSATTWPANFDVPRDAEFRRNGFTAEETLDWVEGGWDSGSAAAAWKTSGLDPDVAKDLEDNGISPDTVAQFAAHGITDPDEVADWHEADIEAERVAEWTDAGFTTGIHVPLPFAVREWGPTGLPARDCAAWSRAHYTPREAVLATAFGNNPVNAPTSEHERAVARHAVTFRFTQSRDLSRRKATITSGWEDNYATAAELDAIAREQDRRKAAGRSPHTPQA